MILSQMIKMSDTEHQFIKCNLMFTKLHGPPLAVDWDPYIMLLKHPESSHTCCRDADSSS